MAIIDGNPIGPPDLVNSNTGENWNKFYSDENEKVNMSAGHRMYILASKYINDGDSILDVGGAVGNEIYEYILKDKPNCKCTVLDISSVACEKGRIKYPDITFIAGGLLETGLSMKYDHILALQVLEHFDRPDEAMARIMSMINPGGTATIGVPHEDKIFYWHQHRFTHESYHFFKQYSTWVSFSDERPNYTDFNNARQFMFVRLIKE